jgi:hypothetical protein
MYTIYHIPGVKIGCTEQPPQDRVKDQGYINYEVLEEHEDVYIASNREIELQKQYGLPVDKVLYYVTLKLKYHPKRLDAVKNSKIIKESGRRCIVIGKTKENQSKNGKKGGKIAGKIVYEQKKGMFSMSEEDKFKVRSNAGKIGGKIVASVERTCFYCNKTTKGPSYFRYHGDKCKAKQ